MHVPDGDCHFVISFLDVDCRVCLLFSLCICLCPYLCSSSVLFFRSSLQSAAGRTQPVAQGDVMTMHEDDEVEEKEDAQ